MLGGVVWGTEWGRHYRGLGEGAKASIQSTRQYSSITAARAGWNCPDHMPTEGCGTDAHPRLLVLPWSQCVIWEGLVPSSGNP